MMNLNNAFAAMEKENEAQVIRQLRMESNEAIARQDADSVARIWTNDFIQIAGDGSLSKGKAKVLSEWKHMFRHGSPLFERIPDEVKVGDSGVMAWETGKWVYRNEKYFGNYSAMWHKVKGKWLTHSELYVSLNS